MDSTRAFLLVDLSAAGAFTYQKPLLQWVKQGFPAVTVLDLDQRSEPVLVTYACRLLEEAEEAVVYFISEKEAGFGALTPLLELVIRQRQKCLVLLQGRHPRLHRMLSARPDLRYFYSEEEEELRERVREVICNNN